MPESENIFHTREALSVMIACSDQGLNYYSFGNKKVFQLMPKQFDLTLGDEMYVFFILNLNERFQLASFTHGERRIAGRAFFRFLT